MSLVSLVHTLDEYDECRLAGVAHERLQRHEQCSSQAYTSNAHLKRTARRSSKGSLAASRRRTPPEQVRQWRVPVFSVRVAMAVGKGLFSVMQLGLVYVCNFQSESVTAKKILWRSGLHLIVQVCCARWGPDARDARAVQVRRRDAGVFVATACLGGHRAHQQDLSQKPREMPGRPAPKTVEPKSCMMRS